MGAEDTLITCKLGNTRLARTDVRRDGSMLCPECGQIYWKAAVDKAMREQTDTDDLRNRIASRYQRESRRSTEFISRRVRVA